MYQLIEIPINKPILYFNVWMCDSCLTTTKRIINIKQNEKIMWRVFTDKEKKQAILNSKASYDYFSAKGRIRYATCWNVITNDIYVDHLDNLYSKVGKAISCNDRLCPICSKKRMNQKRIRLQELILKQELHKKNVYYLVFTLKHTREDTINDLFSKLSSCTSKIRSSMNNAKKGKNSKTVFWLIDWAYWAIETTKTNNWWNLHINYLIFTDSEIELEQARDLKWNLIYNDKWPTMTNKKIQDEWYDITNDSYITSIQKVSMWDNKDTVYKSISEIVKYTMKDDWMSVNDKIAFAKAIKGKRVTGCWGSLYSNQKDDDINTIDAEDSYIDDILEDDKYINEKDDIKRTDFSKMTKVASVDYRLSFDWRNVVYKRDRITYTIEWIQFWLDIDDKVPMSYSHNKDTQKGLSYWT